MEKHRKDDNVAISSTTAYGAWLDPTTSWCYKCRIHLGKVSATHFEDVALGCQRSQGASTSNKNTPILCNILVGQQGKERPMMCVQNATFAALWGFLWTQECRDEEKAYFAVDGSQRIPTHVNTWKPGEAEQGGLVHSDQEHRKSLAVLNITPTVCVLRMRLRGGRLAAEGDLLKLNQIMQFIITNDVSTWADFCSFSQVLWKDRYLSGTSWWVICLIIWVPGMTYLPHWHVR